MDYKYLAAYRNNISSLPFIKIEKAKPIKCGTFGATSLQQRYLATGDFAGNLHIW